MSLKQHSPVPAWTVLIIVYGLIGVYGVIDPIRAHAETTPSGNDRLTFVDGETLVGHLERSDGPNLIFRSNIIGKITVPWSKVKELHSADQYALIPKGVKFGRHRDTDRIPTGAISAHDQQISIAQGPSTQTVPIENEGFVVDQPTFEKSLKRPGPFEAWKGSATAGVSLVLATERNKSYTSAISLTRSIPTEEWMNPENRTIVNFSSSYGQLSQPGQPLTKTSIYHADAERDEYFRPRTYTFVEAAFDHNFSQGLDLEQTFGGGFGWTAVKGPDDQFDLKAALNYVSQQFQLGSTNQHLVGSAFAESYDHRFRYRIVLHQSLSYSPAWSNTNAYSATANVVFTIPIAKRLSVNLNGLDTFLNNPSPGYRKNSFQYTTGVTYTLP